jgi:hypothetical protein
MATVEQRYAVRAVAMPLAEMTTFGCVLVTGFRLVNPMTPRRCGPVDGHPLSLLHGTLAFSMPSRPCH